MTFEYDYIGRRVKKTVELRSGGSWVDDSEYAWVYSGWNKIEERKTVSSTTTIKNFVWGLDLSQSMEGAGGIGGLIAVVDDGGDALLFTYDGNGNVGELLDASDGSVDAHYEYDTYGGSVVASGSQAAENCYRFSTKDIDDETGLVYYGYRFYDAGVGRWVQRDPIGEMGGVNLYGFVGNNSVSRFDLLGLWEMEGVQKILCTDPVGRELIRDVFPKYKIYSYESYDIEVTYYEDAAFTKPTGQQVTVPVLGFHNGAKKVLAADIELTDFEAAMTFIHEGTHGKQYLAYLQRLAKDPAAQELTKREKENEAFAVHHEFLARRCLNNPSLPGCASPTTEAIISGRLTKDETGIWRANTSTIEQDLDESAGYSFRAQEHLKKVTAGPQGGKLVAGKWCCGGTK